METIVFVDYQAQYVDNDGLCPTYKRKSLTPMFGVININGNPFKCVPSNTSNLCAGCAFYDWDYGCMERDLPCSAGLRDDKLNCIFVRAKVTDTLPDKQIYTSEELRDHLKLRFL